MSSQVASITLPVGVPDGLASDLEEFKETVALGLHKTSLLLAGAIAESLLLSRHPDTSDRGPGLKELVEQARSQRLFGRDLLRQLETLVDYRDLIHARAGPRNRISANEARVQHAITALALLCAELDGDDQLKYA